MSKQPGYSVMQAAALCGVSPHTLRAWERRYGVVGPQRTTSGRRLYTREEVERLTRLRALIDAHHSIGAIANLSDADLAALLAGADEAATAATAATPALPASLSSQVEHIRNALIATDLRGLRQALVVARRSVGLREFVVFVVLAVMRRVGQDVLRGALSIGHEHLISSLLRTQLLAELQELDAAKQDKVGRVAVTTMEGDLHEIGVLCGATLMSLAGFETYYLGPNTPASALAAVAQQAGATHILLGRTPLPPQTLVKDAASYLDELIQLLAQGTEVLLGGAWSDVERDDAQVVGDLTALAAYVDGLREAK